MATADISTEIFEQIHAGFQEAFNADKEITRLYKAVADGSTTFADANKFAIKTGELLSTQCRKYITSEALGTGKIRYEVFQKILSPLFGENYRLISGLCEGIQANMYSSIGVGLEPIIPAINKSRVTGFFKKMSLYDTLDDALWMLEDPVVNFSQSVVDGFIKSNADFQFQSGLSPKIIRAQAGDCCEWCENLVGTYEYNDAPSDIYRRHERCRCTVDYEVGRKRQNVHSKVWSDSTPEQIEQRKSAGKK